MDVASLRRRKMYRRMILGILTILLVLVSVDRLPRTWQVSQAAHATLVELAKLDSHQRLSPCRADDPIAIQMDPIPLRGGRSYYYSGYRDLLEGQCAQAASAWQKSLALNPRNEVTLFRLGLLYVQLEQFEQAYQIFQELDPEKRRKLRETLLDADIPPEDRLDVFEMSFWIDPSRVSVRRLDRILTEAGRDHEKWFYYEKLMELASPDTFDYWWANGEVESEHENWQNAAEAYYAGLAVTPEASNRHWLYIGLARSFRQLGNSECADYLQTTIDNQAYDQPFATLCDPVR